MSRAADDSDAEAGRPADETGPIPFEETGPGTDIAVPAVRPGPALLDADSWAEQPAVAIGVPYEGRRRAGPSPARMWLVIALVLAGLGVVVAVPIALFGGGNDAASAAATTGPAGDEVTGDQPLTPGGATLVPPMSVAARTTDPPRSPTPVTSRATTSRGATGAPPFPPVTLEAEADSVSLSGSAWVDNYAGASGGRIVRNVGNWGGQPGKITFNGVVIPTAGAYVITVFYVHLDGEPTRSAEIAFSGADPITQSFTGSSNCCASLALPARSLSPGTHTVTISNQNGHAPSIDKIVISRA